MTLSSLTLDTIINYHVFDCSMPVINGPKNEEDLIFQNQPKGWNPRISTDYLLMWRIALSELYRAEEKKNPKKSTRRKETLKHFLFKLNGQQPLSGAEWEELDRYVTIYNKNWSKSKGE